MFATRPTKSYLASIHDNRAAESCVAHVKLECSCGRVASLGWIGDRRVLEKRRAPGRQGGVGVASTVSMALDSVSLLAPPCGVWRDSHTLPAAIRMLTMRSATFTLTSEQLTE